MADPTQNFAEWLPAARNGSASALGDALEACRVYLQAIAERELDPVLRAKGGASDLVQETFLEAHKDFARFKGDTEAALLGWLRRMLLNNLANFRRSYRGTQKRRAGREVVLLAGDSSHLAVEKLPADSLTPSRRLMAAEDDAEMHGALARLSADDREVIRLRYQEDRPFGEIARLMGRSENAVQKLWLRAVERLQRELQAPQ
jgi:RNA polymerase sigma-70 factor (ECF subfamily)